ncbi:hypothetical protein [Leptodesmis sichuanensis]|uniref:hypothetical protein n=1 Tax=Leptodesmis sichuanensis TaxID=2906798 RepID=UPI001F1DB46B|nr:hypothetical protein [Leptodesmis sichuanensis]UIE37328.1 hypothetical protein KIK02_20650 [Leptodesmis sichuanensis A121]
MRRLRSLSRSNNPVGADWQSLSMLWQKLFEAAQPERYLALVLGWGCALSRSSKVENPHVRPWRLHQDDRPYPIYQIDRPSYAHQPPHPFHPTKSLI